MFALLLSVNLTIIQTVLDCQISHSKVKNPIIFFVSREQLAIAEFSKALLIIPKTLAVNAAQDSADLVAKLRAYHNTSQVDMHTQAQG